VIFIVIIDIEKNFKIPGNNKAGKNNINGIILFYRFIYHACEDI